MKILITGSTDGIGLETAKTLYSEGHTILLHGRTQSKLDAAKQLLLQSGDEGSVEAYLADFSLLDQVVKMAESIVNDHEELDVLINNAGILKSPEPICSNGLDVRFVVNTLAPYLLTERLFSLLHTKSRVVNLSSAAQAPVDINAMNGQVRLEEMAAYSQSKLAITMWSRTMALTHAEGPLFVAVNPGSFLATKMVKEGFGMEGHSIQIGSDILIRAALSDEFTNASGLYFDNDSKAFAQPHPDAMDSIKSEKVMNVIRKLVIEYLS